VEVAAGSTIDRPTVGETRIGGHQKFDNAGAMWPCVITPRLCLCGPVWDSPVATVAWQTV